MYTYALSSLVTFRSLYLFMRFLTIGLIISALFTGATSCNKTRDYAMEGQFYFVNSSSHSITFSAGFEQYNLEANSTSKPFMITDISDREIPAGSYHPPFSKESAFKIPIEPIGIKFDNSRCITLLDDSGTHNILNIASYSSEKLGERKYKFVYTFTESDYNRAVSCK